MNKRRVGGSGFVATTGAVALMSCALAPAVSAHGGDTSLIHSCVNNNSGVVRVVGAGVTCKAGETPLDWAQQGVPGPQGIPGPQGPTGPAGPAGAVDVHFTSQGPGPGFVSSSTFISLDLPAGSYVVTAKTYISSAAYGGCYLISGPGGFETRHQHVFYESGVVRFPVVLVSTITLAEPRRVGIECGNGLGAVTYTDSSVVSAMRLDD
jgi:hypothetical protein